MLLAVAVVALTLAGAPSPAQALTWYNYGINYEPFVTGGHDFNGAALASASQQQHVGASTVVDENGWSPYIFNDVQYASWALNVVGHGTNGMAMFWHTGTGKGASCLRSETSVIAHSHALKDPSGDWQYTPCRSWRLLPTLPTSSLHLALFQTCNSGLAPSGYTTTLLTTIVGRGADSAAGFNGTIAYGDGSPHSMEYDFSDGFWGAWCDGTHTTSVDTSLDRGVLQVSRWHANTGGYANHRRYGANPGY
jgi:hypothetical protein